MGTPRELDRHEGHEPHHSLPKRRGRPRKRRFEMPGPKICLGDLNREASYISAEVFKELNKKRFLLNELMEAQTQAERELIQELMEISVRNLGDLEDIYSRLRMAIDTYNSSAINFTTFLQPEEIQAFQRVSQHRKGKRGRPPKTGPILLTGTNGL